MRVAVLQCTSAPLDVAGNLERLDAACRSVAGRADVLVTPEMFTTGYDIGRDETFRLAEPADGPIARAVAETTRRTGVAVVYGYPELGSAGEVYNAAQLVDDGAVRSSHRKLHLFGDLDRDRFTPGQERPRVADLRGHPVGLLLCYDVEFPEATRSLALAGAGTVLVPTANMADYDLVPTVLVRARAFENGVFLVYANYTGTEGGLEYGGLSTVCAPDGTVLALAGRDEQLDVVELVGTGSMGYLADRRPDLFGEASP
ncbi:carbon-nitrogen hydrolase [Blastococcus sp. TBT05-19]|nr:carbon-nitrogen hydrolase [Blastococcus sp. TBT05-19]